MKTVQLKNIELCKLKPFAHHPYKVRDDEEMEALIESIRINGIMTPLLVRPIDGSPGEYEVISGHRRMHAAEKAGLKTESVRNCRATNCQGRSPGHDQR